MAKEIQQNSGSAKEKELFIANVVHDLKTPTIAQIRALELLLKGSFGDFSPTQKDIIDQTLNSCKYMLAMISGILKFYKEEGGSFDTEVFDIAMLSYEVVRELEHYNEKKHNAIILSAESDKLLVLANRLEIKRVIINLLSNAIKYSVQDYPIKIKLKKSDEKVKIIIQNKSAITDQDNIHFLFNKFTSNANKINKEGIGLGLFSSKQIISEQNGNMIAFIEDKNTYNFGFELPYIKF